ncbi:MAG: hypothetical protein IAE80_17695 [Anaerolinea sp.]|nr:hypothetical protein [Anaerolinea sp.]
MTDKPQTEQAEGSKFNLQRIAIIAAGVLIGLVILLFVIALLLSTAGDSVGNIIRIIRDLVIIFLALEGVLIILGLALLTLQVARLVNLLQTEVKPILENTQETVKTAQGTVEFVGSNITEPLIAAGGFFAGASVLVNNLFGIRRALKHIETEGDHE